MTKPKILYWVQRKQYRRVFLPFREDPNFVQAMLMPSFVKRDGFKIHKKYLYDRGIEIKNHIKNFRPDVIVTCEGFSTGWYKKIKKYGIKLVYVNHGTWDNSPSVLERTQKDVWKNFDLLCGGTNLFRTIMEKNSMVTAQIVTNALPQFDVLYDNLKESDNFRREVLEKSKNMSAKKIITFFGHRCVGRKDMKHYNEDYYRTATHLNNLAKKYDWLIVIKPKRTDSFNFIKRICGLKGFEWAKNLQKEYAELKESKNVMFVSPYNEAYQYICASDVIVCTGRSTIEIESSLANKTLVKICTEKSEFVRDDTRKTLKYGAAHAVRVPDDLEDIMVMAVENSHDKNIAQRYNQNILVEHHGITFDGMACVRVLNAMRPILQHSIEERNIRSNSAELAKTKKMLNRKIIKLDKIEKELDMQVKEFDRRKEAQMKALNKKEEAQVEGFNKKEEELNKKKIVQDEREKKLTIKKKKLEKSYFERIKTNKESATKNKKKNRIRK